MWLGQCNRPDLSLLYHSADLSHETIIELLLCTCPSLILLQKSVLNQAYVNTMIGLVNIHTTKHVCFIHSVVE